MSNKLKTIAAYSYYYRDSNKNNNLYVISFKTEEELNNWININKDHIDEYDYLEDNEVYESELGKANKCSKGYID